LIDVVGETVGPEEAAGPTGVEAMFADIRERGLRTPYSVVAGSLLSGTVFVLLILGARGGCSQYGISWGGGATE